MAPGDVVVISALSGALLVTLAVVGRQMFAVCHDEEYAKVAGLPVGVPGLTVDRQCGSGLAAVVLFPVYMTIVRALSPPPAYVRAGQPPYPVDVDWGVVTRAFQDGGLGPKVLRSTVVTILVFSLLYFAPGDPATIIGGDLATPEEIARFQEFCEELGVSPVYLVDWPIANDPLATRIIGEAVRQGRRGGGRQRGN